MPRLKSAEGLYYQSSTLRIVSLFLRLRSFAALRMTAGWGDGSRVERRSVRKRRVCGRRFLRGESSMAIDSKLGLRGAFPR